jgi:hypothetical protein
MHIVSVLLLIVVRYWLQDKRVFKDGWLESAVA